MKRFKIRTVLTHGHAGVIFLQIRTVLTHGNVRQKL